MAISKPVISVVIGAYNQIHCLPLVLEEFEKQTLDHGEFEVIVVDSTSTDGTSEFVKSYSPSYNFVGIVQENKGKTAARNRGVELAKGDIIFITDSDMIPHPDLLQRHVDAQASVSSPTCFEGQTCNLKVLEWPTTSGNMEPYITRDYSDGKSLGWYYFLTGNISFPKQLFLAEGGFDPDFLGYGWEDLELGYRLSKKKVPLIYLKQAINYHYHVITRDEDIQRHVKKGASAQIFVKKHPELKWFLGMNPLSVWLRKHLTETSWLVRFARNCYGSSNPIADRFGFWFLKEYHYLGGVLDIL